MLSEITSKSVEPNVTLINDAMANATVLQTGEMKSTLVATTSSAYLIIDTTSFLMTTNIIADDGETATGTLSINGDISSSSIYFNVLTSIENTAVLYVTTSILKRDSTTILPAATNILSTFQMDGVTVLPTITALFSMNGESGNVVMATGVPSEKSSNISLSISAIVGMAAGVITLIATVIIICIVVFSLVRKKRIKRKYNVNWIQHEQAGDYSVAN